MKRNKNILEKIFEHYTDNEVEKADELLVKYIMETAVKVHKSLNVEEELIEDMERDEEYDLVDEIQDDQDEIDSEELYNEELDSEELYNEELDDIKDEDEDEDEDDQDLILSLVDDIDDIDDNDFEADTEEEINKDKVEEVEDDLDEIIDTISNADDFEDLQTKFREINNIANDEDVVDDHDDVVEEAVLDPRKHSKNNSMKMGNEGDIEIDAEPVIIDSNTEKVSKKIKTKDMSKHIKKDANLKKVKK